MAKTTHPERDKTIMGAIGRLGYSGVEDHADSSSYSFNKDYCTMMNLLLNKHPLANPISTEVQTEDEVISNFYQIGDTCVQVSSNHKISRIDIFNRNPKKRDETLKLLEQAFK
ncbi:MAG: hypothetical protein NTZ83_06415 [Candidatus Pacearchaeota archaeon]|nr:hypothetical protein [Candidatus Pacearchaeota archaeon]